MAAPAERLEGLSDEELCMRLTGALEKTKVEMDRSGSPANEVGEEVTAIYREAKRRGLMGWSGFGVVATRSTRQLDADAAVCHKCGGRETEPERLIGMNTPADASGKNKIVISCVTCVAAAMGVAEDRLVERNRSALAASRK